MRERDLYLQDRIHTPQRWTPPLPTTTKPFSYSIWPGLWSRPHSTVIYPGAWQWGTLGHYGEGQVWYSWGVDKLFLYPLPLSPLLSTQCKSHECSQQLRKWAQKIKLPSIISQNNSWGSRDSNANHCASAHFHWLLNYFLFLVSAVRKSKTLAKTSILTSLAITQPRKHGNSSWFSKACTGSKLPSLCQLIEWLWTSGQGANMSGWE
jgi:hypothetical protein